MAGPENDPVKQNPQAGKEAAPSAPATKYVGTPAVGTSKAAAAGGIAAVGPDNSEVDQRRRRLAWIGITAFLGAWFLAFFRFFLPRTLFEPRTSFKIGYPSDFGSASTPNFRINTASGWCALRRACS